jgi:hypothetical protein
MSLASLGKTNLTRTIQHEKQQQLQQEEEQEQQEHNPLSASSSRIGSRTSASEMDLKERDWFTPEDYKQWVHDPPRYAPNPVFLYDTQQLLDDDDDDDHHDNTTTATVSTTTTTTTTTTTNADGSRTRARQFRHDLHHFLGFHPTHELPPVLHYSPGTTRRFNATEQARRNALKISICDVKHGILREELMEIAQQVGPWIRDYFLKSPDVVVSSPDYFVSHILESYQHDPCLSAR